MKDYIRARTLELADYILDTGATVRDAAKLFLVSKSTVHKDVAGRLKQIDNDKYEQIKKVLDFNLSERHIRGGISTQKRYKGAR
ncbi:MAG: sporulation transcriptional regulator SpoIIID [Firmicutes bacterium]|nr:sporulation transcriptional regulator SpoIIID [Bacillota bacterium]